MNYIIYTLLIASLFSCQMNAQFVKTASCQNSDFDKKVNSYLSYSAPVISVKEAHDKQTEYTFLDAREYNEFTVSHLPGAKYIGYDDFDIRNVSELNKDAKIVVYCSIGYRSEKIATKLRKQGYKNVYNLYGSIFEWANMGYDLKDKENKLTSTVHTYNKSWSKWLNSPTVKKTW